MHSLILYSYGIINKSNEYSSSLFQKIVKLIIVLKIIKQTHLTEWNIKVKWPLKLKKAQKVKFFQDGIK